MSSSLFKRFGQRQQAQEQNINRMVENVRQFQNTFSGDPAQTLQSLVSSGRVPQDVLNRAQEMARPIYNAMKALR